MASSTALLAAVEQSILEILSGGQSYSIRSRAARKAELETLRQMRKELLEEVRADTGGPRVSVGMQVLPR